MGAGGKVNDEAEARRCSLAAKRAGQTAAERARARGVDGRSLRAWKIKFDWGKPHDSVRRPPKPARAVASALVELVPREPSTTTRARYVLEVGEARIEFGDDVSAETLRRVVQVLRSC